MSEPIDRIALPYRVYSFDEVESPFSFPSNTGSGQVVGVIGWGAPGGVGVDLGERPYVEVICVGAQTNGTTSGELMMDTLIVHTLLPDATLRVYLALNQGDAIAEAIELATGECTVTTCSFGYPYQDEVWTDEACQRIDAALQRAGERGVTACFASGDSGATRVAYPASSPYALAVGGVMVPTEPDPHNTVAQVWWNWIMKQGAQRWMASGGGVNTRYAPPAFQSALLPVQNTAGVEMWGRATPDVAGFGQGLAGWEGTSACSPLWASLIGRINCALGYHAGTTPVGVGDIHDVIYDTTAAAGAFTDITLGNNVPPMGEQTWGYAAHPGWDACTGWGTPIGTTLMNALQAARSAPMPNATHPPRTAAAPA